MAAAKLSRRSFLPLNLLITALFITGCTQMCGVKRGDMTPEQVVEAYLETALNMKDIDERELLVQYTTGNLKSAIEAASPETIKTAYIDRRYELLNYSVVERRDRTPRETEISFQMSYHDLGANSTGSGEDTKDVPKVTTENTVSVVREDGIWKIRDVLGNKTAIDFPVSKDSEITAKPGVITEPDESDDQEFAPPPGEE